MQMVGRDQRGRGNGRVTIDNGGFEEPLGGLNGLRLDVNNSATVASVPLST